MYDLTRAREVFDSSLRSEDQLIETEYKELTELIDGLHNRAVLLRRQISHFNYYLDSCMDQNDEEYGTLLSFLRPLTQSIAELEEYRRKVERRHHESNASK
ncbi:unnamed protein product [Rodentolepis nana]|uniref:Transcriptional regulator n=1 Tax=Rodentolepis nana TaxID=102285 RepID=A0A0R3T601_RODNA|nr:unnamed protein product [Rodentolepis nana]